MNLYRYRDLIWVLVLRDLRVRYRRSAIGFVWTMLQPLLTMAVLSLVFSWVFRFDIDNFAVYALSGIVLWNMIHQTITTSMNSLRANVTLLHKMPVPMEVFPVSSVLSGLVNLAFALVPLLLVVVVSGGTLTRALLWLPLAFLLVGLFTLGLGLILSPLSVFFHDVVEIVGVGLTLLMYLTPLFYPLSIVPEQVRWVIEYSPLRSLLETFRQPIYAGTPPPWGHTLWAAAVAVALVVIGTRVFRRHSHRVRYFM